MSKKRIFVSYSHQDAALVNPVVRLLRVAVARDLVFVDSDSIEPGQKWEDTIHGAIAQANMIVVFWCWHSSTSGEVLKEYQAAKRIDKSVLPVLLDSTPMPQDLSEYQWIDFRELAGTQHECLGGNDEKPRDVLANAKPPRSYAAPRGMRFLLPGILACILVVLALSSVWFLQSAPMAVDDTPAAATPMPTLPPPPSYVEAAPSLMTVTVLVLVLLFLPTTFILLRLKRSAVERRARREATPEGLQMAERLRSELQRAL